jgi:hypothetical protein
MRRCDAGKRGAGRVREGEGGGGAPAQDAASFSTARWNTVRPILVTAAAVSGARSRMARQMPTAPASTARCSGVKPCRSA